MAEIFIMILRQQPEILILVVQISGLSVKAIQQESYLKVLNIMFTNAMVAISPIQRFIIGFTLQVHQREIL